MPTTRSSNLIRTTNPLGQINTSVFDLANRLVAQIDPLGNRTSFAYDVAGTRSGRRIRLGRSRPASLTRQSAGGDDRSRWGTAPASRYDFADEQIRTTNPLGIITTTVFDKLLRPVASVDPLLNRTTTAYDAAGRPIRIQDANAQDHDHDL